MKRLTTLAWSAAAVASLATLYACSDQPTVPEPPSVAPPPKVAAALTGGGPTGAIFTTTPDGGIVNENVRYPSKIYVYLDGGPRNNAPQGAAGLDDGYYVFQITDPSGKYLLSQDPSKCRVVRVADGVIKELVAPSAIPGQTLTNDYKVGNTTYPCSIADAPTPPTAAGPTDAGASGRHDTNVDVDHGASGAIVVQMMPFGTTPNPGGVYKAWVSKFDAYLTRGGNLSSVPSAVKGKDAQPCPDFCAAADPGFGPPRSLQKTDNFKVQEVPPRIIIDKINDLNGNGAFDTGEPYVAGWPVHVTETLADNSTITNDYFTQASVAVAPNTSPVVCEDVQSGYAFKFALINGAPATATLQNGQACVTVPVGTTNVAVAFGNFQLASKSGIKFHDRNANGTQGAGEGALSGWRIELLKYNGSAYVFQSYATTASGTGAYSFTGLDVGTYAVCEVAQTDWYQSAPASAPTGETLVNCAGIDAKYSGNGFGFVVNTSGQTLSGNNFGNYQQVSISGTKSYDLNWDGVADRPLQGWVIHLLSTSGTLLKTATTDASGNYSFTGLTPGSYVVCEVQQAGYTETSPIGAPGTTISCTPFNAINGVTYGPVGYLISNLLSGSATASGRDFCNAQRCDGLSPGYWTNWNNHYTSAQFLTLLQGTIASGNISLANTYLTSTGCDDGDAIACMRRMLLADQLTVRLTALNYGGAGLPNPSGGNLWPLCQTATVTGTLSDVFANALAIHNANGVGYTRDQILAAKNALAAFITK